MKIKNVFNYLVYSIICLVMIIDITIPGFKYLNLNRVVCIALFFCSFLYGKINKGRKKGKIIKYSESLWWIITAGCLMSILSSASMKSNNIQYILYYLFFPIGLVSVSYLFRNPYRAKSLLEAYFSISVAIAVLGYYEAFTGNIIHVTPGAYIHLRNFMGLHLPNTVFYNINDNAVFMMMSLCVGYILSEYVDNGILIRILSIILFGGNIIFVDSRGAEMAMIAFLLLYYMLKMRANKKVLAIGIMFLCIVLAYPYVLQFSLFAEGISNTGRALIWVATVENIKNNLFWGVGPGNIVSYNRMLGTGSVYAVHNYLLEIAADLGIIVAFVWCVWYAKLIIDSFRIYYKSNTALVVFCALISFIPLSIVSSSLVEKSWLVLFFGILVAQLNRDYKI